MAEPLLKFDERVLALKSEAAFEYLAMANEMAKKGMDIISFGIGQPDFDTPDFIKEEAKKALDEGFTGYVEAKGIPELREAVAEYVNEATGSDVKPEEVIILPGAKPGIYFSALCFIRDGDEVIIPDPSYPVYESVVKHAGGRPVFVKLKEENEFSLRPEDLEGLINDRTRMIILNNPHNPTGSLLSPSDLKGILEIAKERGIIVLSDEIYDKYVYEGGFLSVLSDPDWRDYAIYVNGFSKTFSMTGWRLGYLIARREVIDRMGVIALNTFSCTPGFIQRAGIVALKGVREVIEERIKEFKRRRDAIYEALKRLPGVKVVKPKGAFYIFPNFKEVMEGAGLSTEELAMDILRRKGVVTLPGTAFPERGGEGYLRLSFAVGVDKIERGIERIKEYIEEIQGSKGLRG